MGTLTITIETGEYANEMAAQSDSLTELDE
jgi:hypothetical protein